MAECCRVVQYVAVCCSMLQCVAVCYGESCVMTICAVSLKVCVLQCVACVAVNSSVLQYVL